MRIRSLEANKYQKKVDSTRLKFCMTVSENLFNMVITLVNNLIISGN
jgi:hypothetical protein